jgi:DNA polymerase III subunit epsilon
MTNEPHPGLIEQRPVGRSIPGHWTCGTLIGFDLETTGTDPFNDLPVSYALVTFEDRRPVHTDAGLVDCGRDSHPDAEAIHGVSRQRARTEGMAVDEAAERIAEAVCRAGRDGVPVVGMNVSFDLTILDTMCRRFTGAGLSERGWAGPAVDCYVLDKQVDRYRKGSRRLADLCHHYGVVHRGAHDAAADVEAAVEVAIALCQGNDELVGMDLRTLTERQVEWKRAQVADFSRWRVGKGQPALAAWEHDWPVATPPGPDALRP